MLHSRDKRIAGLLKESLARIFQQEISDPRMPQIFTVSEVAVSRDLRHAKVFFSQLPDDDESVERTGDLIASSAGFIRSQVARELNLRHCPALHFEYDPSMLNFQRINSILHKVRKDPETGET